MLIFTGSILFIILNLLVTNQRPIDPKRVKWAVNCGSDKSYRSHKGFIYEKDQNFEQNQYQITRNFLNSEDTKDEIIYYSKDKNVHMTHRSSHTNIKYNIPLGEFEENKYVLILRFVEMEYHKPNKRQFDIKLGGQTIIDNFDVASKFKGGKFYAYDEYIEFEFKTKRILWKKPKSQEKYILDLSVDGFLTLELIQKLDYPFINAIILYQGQLSDTNYYEISLEQEEWVRQNKEVLQKQINERKSKEEQERKRESIHIKNSQSWANSQEDLIEEEEGVIPPLNELLMTPFGVVAMIGFFGTSFVLIYFTFFDPYGRVQNEKYSNQENQNLIFNQEKDEQVKQSQYSQAQQETQGLLQQNNDDGQQELKKRNVIQSS